MPNGNDTPPGSGDPSTDASVTKPPQFMIIVATAAAVGGAVGAIVGQLIGGG
jgi:hypothetical protein